MRALRILGELVGVTILAVVLLVPLLNFAIVALDLSPRLDPAYVMFDPKTDAMIENGALPQQPDPHCLWKPRPGAFINGDEFNAEGYRGPVIPDRKSEGTVRIAVLGDSQAFGHVVPDRESWPRRLEELARLRGHRVEVLNAAVWGHSVVQQLARLEELVAPKRPDVVLLAFSFINDMAQAPHGRPDSLRIELFSDPDLKFQNRVRGTSIWRGLKRIVHPERKASYLNSNGTCRVPPKEFAATIATMVRRIREIGATPVIVVPWRRSEVDRVPMQREFDRALRAIAAVEAVRLIDLVDLRRRAVAAFFRADDEAAMDGPFFDPYHYTAKGNDFVAGMLSLVLQRMSLLGPAVDAPGESPQRDR